jgi:hypothetical protein
VPGTKLVSAANPMEALETWLYNDVEFKAHPHVVIEQQGNVMHGFMDVIIPLMPGTSDHPPPSPAPCPLAGPWELCSGPHDVASPCTRTATGLVA